MIDQRVKVVFHRNLTGDTFLLGLHAPEVLASARPGQFVMLGAGNFMDPLLRRPFSICGGRDGETLLILYRVVGRGTALLARTPEGFALPCLGPLGRGFKLPRGDERVLAVGGGVGVAPLLFLMQALTGHPAELLMGCRSAADLIPLDMFGIPPDALSIATEDGTRGRDGLVTDLLAERLCTAPEGGYSVCACGPRPMLKAVADLARHSATPCQVSLEAHMACGVGACQGCAVAAARQEARVYFHVCRDGPVFPAAALEWETK